MNHTRSSDLSSADTWTGGYYEAALVLGSNGSRIADERLRSAIAAVWSIERFDLKYAGPGRSKEAKHIDFTASPLEEVLALYGHMMHEKLGIMPITTQVVREMECDAGDDWLYIGVPLGGLSMVFPGVGGWPLGNLEASTRWRWPLEQILADTALEVSKTVPFKVAAVGYEIAGIIDEGALNGNIPSERWVGYVTPANDKFAYLPTTRWN